MTGDSLLTTLLADFFRSSLLAGTTPATRIPERQLTDCKDTPSKCSLCQVSSKFKGRMSNLGQNIPIFAHGCVSREWKHYSRSSPLWYPWTTGALGLMTPE